MEKNFTFKVFNRLEEKLEQDWKSLENEVKTIFFSKICLYKNCYRDF